MENGGKADGEHEKTRSENSPESIKVDEQHIDRREGYDRPL